MNKYVGLIKSFLKKEMILDQVMLGLNRKRLISIPPITNYIRISTLELVAAEISNNKVDGAIAELGVYKGEFAKFMNQAFPERTFYLFDTFEGFDNRDIKAEVDNNYSTGKQDFSNTSVQNVLGKMKFPAKCVIKQGWFPESLNGLEDKFCFVSLDADLYKPILDGLKYFYPRLSKGGYIFIHDYNNGIYEGAKVAVREFCKSEGIAYTPISDTWGSVIIAK